MDASGLNEKRRRPLAGVLVGTAVLAVVAVPAFWTGMFTLFSLSGCFLECSEPDPKNAAGWGAVTVLLLALPLSAGLAVARARQRWAFIFAVALAVLGIFAWFTQGAV